MKRRPHGLATAALVGAILILSLAGCSRQANEPCAGLVYTDAGLTREQYAPCAKEMVVKLDEIWQDVETAFNYNLSETERANGRQACFRACGDLARLMKQAGGSQKLVRLEWADARLSEFNRNVDAAHTEYFLFCFYGAAGRSPTEISRRHVEAKRFAESLE